MKKVLHLSLVLILCLSLLPVSASEPVTIKFGPTSTRRGMLLM